MTALSPAPDRSGALEDAREGLVRAIRSGFDSLDDVVELALESITEGEDVPDADQLSAQLRAMALAETDRLRAEQVTWPTTTDNDRLELAFSALESGGIVARQNFTCCQTCGHAEIGDEIETAREAGREVRGYTFFHQQDTERAAEGGGILLAYGPAAEGVDLATVGHEVADALRDAGLTVEWTGDVSKRIGVAMRWQKRSNAALDDTKRR